MLTMPEIQYDSVKLLNRKECVVIIYYVIWCTVFQHCDHFLTVHSKFCSLINFKLINLLIYLFFISVWVLFILVHQVKFQFS